VMVRALVTPRLQTSLRSSGSTLGDSTSSAAKDTKIKQYLS